MSQIKNFSKTFEQAIVTDRNYEAEVDNASFNRDQGSISIEGLLEVGQVSSKKELTSYYENLCKTIFEKNYSEDGWEILKWNTDVSLSKPKKFGTVFSVSIRFEATNMLVEKLNKLIAQFINQPSSKADLNNLVTLGESLGIYNVKERIVSRLNKMPTGNYKESQKKYDVLKALDLVEGSEFDLTEADFTNAWYQGLGSYTFKRTLDLAVAAGIDEEFYKAGWYDMLELVEDMSEIEGLVSKSTKPFKLIYLDPRQSVTTFDAQDELNEELEGLAEELQAISKGSLTVFIGVDRGNEFALNYEYRW